MVADPLSSLWPILHYDGPEAARRFLVEVVGFREGVVVRDDGDDIVHAELRWPGGGVLLFGDTKHVDGVHAGLRAAALYLVTDDVDAVHRRVRDAGAEIVVAPHATEFGAGGPTYACRAGHGGEPADLRDVPWRGVSGVRLPGASRDLRRRRPRPRAGRPVPRAGQRVDRTVRRTVSVRRRRRDRSRGGRRTSSSSRSASMARAREWYRSESYARPA